MEVEDFHTYYIAKTGVLVHNDGGCGHSGGKVRISSKSDRETNLLDELASSGVKYNSEDIVTITKLVGNWGRLKSKTADGKYQWITLKKVKEV